MGTSPMRAQERATSAHAALDTILAAQLEAHAELLRAVRDHRDAVRRADVEALGRAQAAQSGAVRTIAELEDRRRRLLEAVPARGTRGAGPQPVRTLAEFCADAPEGVRQRLAALGAALRSAAEEARREQAGLREAIAALVRHAEGLGRTVARRLNECATYGRRGVGPGHGASLALDLST